uniref:Uncharacterized protein n=1 Tax=Triticum urartu TaxID=4572 RepID=A0A8R7VCJ5_TRIUA
MVRSSASTTMIPQRTIRLTRLTLVFVETLRYWLYNRGFPAMAIHGDKTQEVNTYSELFCHRLTLVYGHVHPAGCRWPAASLEEHGRNVGCASTLSSTNPQQPRV